MLSPDLVTAVVAETGLTDEAKVELLAWALVLEEGGPVAEQLTAMPQLDAASCSWADIRGAVDVRRAVLRGTVAWPAAERMLAAATGAPSRGSSSPGTPSPGTPAREPPSPRTPPALGDRS